jgi:lipopolysaccharide export system protein LptC
MAVDFTNDRPGHPVPDPRYRAALRHSSRVRFFKRAIPLGAVLTVVVIAGLAWFEPFRAVIPASVSIGSVDLNGTRITMELPKLTGFKRDLRPYEVTAKSASQDIRQPTIIDLNELKARIALEDKGSATLVATTGVYDSQKETLQLKDDVRVRTDSGYDAQLKSARVDFKSGTVLSDEAVRVRLNGGTIDADTLQILDNGKRIVFTGHVKTFIDPTAVSGADGQPAAREAKDQ